MAVLREAAELIKVKEEILEIDEEFDNNRNPWSHLNKFLWYKETDRNNYTFYCKACLPLRHEIRAHRSSYNNIKSHFQRKHQFLVTELEDACKASSNRGKKRRITVGPASTATEIVDPPHQLTRESFEVSAATAGVSQASVDRALVDLVVYGMYPLQIADCPWFRNFAQVLNPTTTIPSTSTLGRRVIESFIKKKEQLMKNLINSQWVATTADCWTAAKKRYLGMTVHWLNSDTRQREHGVLACVQLKGKYTYEVLAKAIKKIHVEFHIEKKVTMTTTDNARNFNNTFVQFGEKINLFPWSPIQSPFPEDDMDEAQADLLQQLLTVREVDDDETVEFVSVDDIAEEVMNVEYSGTYLEGHIKCGVHTWNLIACKDSEKALEDSTFEKAYRTALTKAKALWNHQNQSTITTDAFYNELNRRLVVPNDIRWNTMFNAVVCLNKILEEKKDSLHRVMVHHGLPTFHDQDINFMAEYIKVMQPVVTVLDILQAERNAYLGWLLPLCATTVIRLHEVKNKQLHYCASLLDALLAGIKKRFDPILERDECLLAAGFHPRFRLLWLDKYDRTTGKREYAKKLMEAKVEEYLRHEVLEKMSNSSCEEEAKTDDFMDVISRHESVGFEKSLEKRTQDLVRKWLDGKLVDSLDDTTFMHEKVLMDLFIRYNTAVSSGASVECLFSLGKDIRRANRFKLSDEAFNMLMFMKDNEHHHLHEWT